jgi:hypothetical protein
MLVTVNKRAFRVSFFSLSIIDGYVVLVSLFVLLAQAHRLLFVDRQHRISVSGWKCNYQIVAMSIPLAELRLAQQGNATAASGSDAIGGSGNGRAGLTVEVPSSFLGVGPTSPTSPTPTPQAIAARDRANHQLLMSPQSNAAALASIRARAKAKDASSGGGSSGGTDGRLLGPHSRSQSMMDTPSTPPLSSPANGMASMRRASIGNASELLASRRVARKKEKAAAAAAAEATKNSPRGVAPTPTSATTTAGHTVAFAPNVMDGRTTPTQSAFTRPTSTGGTTVGSQRRHDQPHQRLRDGRRGSGDAGDGNADGHAKHRAPAQKQSSLNVSDMISYVVFLVFFTLATFFARGDQSAFYLVCSAPHHIHAKFRTWLMECEIG